LVYFGWNQTLRPSSSRSQLFSERRFDKRLGKKEVGVAKDLASDDNTGRKLCQNFRQVSDKEWRLLVLTQAEETLTLESLAIELPLAEIYRNVAF
jgi:hypothetical protein